MNDATDDVMAALPPVKYNITDAALADLAEKHKDVDARQDYELAKAALKECTSLRTSLEARRKELKKDALEYGRKVDGEAKRILAKILKVEEPIKKTKEEVDNEAARREAERVASVEAEYNLIAEYTSFLYGKTTAAIASAIEGLKNHALHEDLLQERYHDARELKDDLLAKLQAEYDRAAEAQRILMWARGRLIHTAAEIRNQLGEL
jgi:hypothetical protein